MSPSVGLVVCGMSIISVAALRGVEIGVDLDTSERGIDTERDCFASGESARWMLPGVLGCIGESPASVVRTTLGVCPSDCCWAVFDDETEVLIAPEIVRPRGRISEVVRGRGC